MPYAVSTTNAVVFDHNAHQLSDVQFASVGLEVLFPNIFVVPQGILERVLYERLLELGGFVEWDCELVGVEQDDKGAQARFVDGTRTQHTYIIGCDGANGVVSSLIGNKGQAEGGLFNWSPPPNPPTIFADVTMRSSTISATSVSIFLLPTALCLFFPMLMVQDGVASDPNTLPPQPVKTSPTSDSLHYFRVVLSDLSSTSCNSSGNGSGGHRHHQHQHHHHHHHHHHHRSASSSSVNSSPSTPASTTPPSVSTSPRTPQQVFNAHGTLSSPNSSVRARSVSSSPQVSGSSARAGPGSAGVFMTSSSTTTTFGESGPTSSTTSTTSTSSFTSLLCSTPVSGSLRTPSPGECNTNTNTFRAPSPTSLFSAVSLMDEEELHESSLNVMPEEFLSKFFEVSRVAKAEVRDIYWLKRYEPETRLAERFRNGRVFIAGDSAHSNNIFGGYGLNIGLQDAVNLSWKMALSIKGEASSGLLETYEEERREIGRQMIRNAETLSQVLATRSGTLQSVRNFALSFSTGFQFVHDNLSQALTAVRYNYCNTRLTVGPYPAGYSIPPIDLETHPDRVSCSIHDLMYRRTEMVFFFFCPNKLCATDKNWMYVEEAAASIRTRFSHRLVSFCWIVEDDTTAELATAMDDGLVFFDTHHGFSNLCKTEPMRMCLRPDGMVAALFNVDSTEDLSYLSKIFV
ncbi:unnamed protein product [Sphagnum balticum]